MLVYSTAQQIVQFNENHFIQLWTNKNTKNWESTRLARKRELFVPFRWCLFRGNKAASSATSILVGVIQKLALILDACPAQLIGL